MKYTNCTVGKNLKIYFPKYLRGGIRFLELNSNILNEVLKHLHFPIKYNYNCSKLRLLEIINSR